METIYWRIILTVIVLICLLLATVLIAIVHFNIKMSRLSRDMQPDDSVELAHFHIGKRCFKVVGTKTHSEGGYIELLMGMVE